MLPCKGPQRGTQLGSWGILCLQENKKSYENDIVGRRERKISLHSVSEFELEMNVSTKSRKLKILDPSLGEISKVLKKT